LTLGCAGSGLGPPQPEASKPAAAASAAGAGALASSYTPFAVPIGGQDPVTGLAKTKLQTNMRKGNEFPPPQCLILFSLQIYFAPTMSKVDISKWMTSCYIEFRIDEKIFHEGHIQRFPGGEALSELGSLLLQFRIAERLKPRLQGANRLHPWMQSLHKPSIGRSEQGSQRPLEAAQGAPKYRAQHVSG